MRQDICNRYLSPDRDGDGSRTTKRPPIRVGMARITFPSTITVVGMPSRAMFAYASCTPAEKTRCACLAYGLSLAFGSTMARWADGLFFANRFANFGDAFLRGFLAAI
jgi:hypothetical protein